MNQAASEAHPFLWTLVRAYGLYFGTLIMMASVACVVYFAVSRLRHPGKRSGE